MKINTIIFDFGGIFLDLHFDRSFKAVSELLGITIQRNHIPGNINKVFEDYEMGLISTESLIKELEIICGKDINTINFHNAWNAMLLGIPRERLLFLEKIINEYDVYLLSNTNEIHIQWVYHYLKNEIHYPQFEDLFKKVYYSHKLHMRKPNPDIYKYVLTDAHLEPATTLFIDDTPENVATANSLGIRGVLHDPSTNIAEKLPEYLVNAE